MTGAGRVLVIDDDPFMQRLVEAHLTEAGLTVELASGGEEGVARARALAPAAIVLDFAMPHVSGQDVLVRLRSDPRTAAIPVIIVTAWSSTEQREGAMALGAAWLEKPVQGPALVSAVQQLIHDGQSCAASVRRP